MIGPWVILMQCPNGQDPVELNVYIPLDRWSLRFMPSADIQFTSGERLGKEDGVG